MDGHYSVEAIESYMILDIEGHRHSSIRVRRQRITSLGRMRFASARNIVSIPNRIPVDARIITVWIENQQERDLRGCGRYAKKIIRADSAGRRLKGYIAEGHGLFDQVRSAGYAIRCQEPGRGGENRQTVILGRTGRPGGLIGDIVVPPSRATGPSASSESRDASEFTGRQD